MDRALARARAALIAALVWTTPAMVQAVETAGPGWVAGLAPHQRPQGAPVIKVFTPDSAWRARALTGIGAPVPASLRFLDDQGAWYPPFNHPGPPGYYDLRNWHGSAGQANVKQAR